MEGPWKEINNLKKLINEKRIENRKTQEKDNNEDFSKIIGLVDRDYSCNDGTIFDEFYMIGPDNSVYEVFSYYHL